MLQRDGLARLAHPGGSILDRTAHDHAPHATALSLAVSPLTPPSPLLSRPFSQLYAGASVAAAQSLAQSEAEVAINWSGGQTHARRDCASGHSYVNDVVLATLQLLTTFERVLIVNVDACHASGVEEAFYTTDRVMFLSAHVHRDGFFPGSGGAKDTGEGAGKHHTINLPMLDGAGDEDLHSLLLPVLEKTLERYQPHAVVCCAGTSILAGDQLGCMNVSMSGHARCLQPLLAYKRPLLLLGGSGNTGAVSARAWANATALACQTELASEIPEHDFHSYYGPGFKLEVPSAVVESMNCEARLTAIREAALQTLAQLPTYAKLPPPVPPPAPAAEPATGDATVDDNSPADGTHATKLENGAAPAPADDASAEEMAQAGSDAESKEAAEPDADAAETKTTPGEDDAEAMEGDEVADNAANGAAAESHPDAAADE